MLISTCPWGQNPKGAGEPKLLIPFLLPSLVSWFDLSLPAESVKKLINYLLDMPSCWLKLELLYCSTLDKGSSCYLAAFYGQIRTAGSNSVLYPLISPRIFPALSCPLGSQSHSHALSPQQNCNLKVRIPEHDIFNGSEAFFLPLWPSRERTPDTYLLFQHYVGRLQTIK